MSQKQPAAGQEKSMRPLDTLASFKGKRVLVTGHTGFKGAWLSRILLSAGAEVTGVALPPEGEPSLFGLLGLEKDLHSVFCDVRDFEGLSKVFAQASPEIVLHLAAQPLVLESYRRPRETYEINAMGTVNVLECIRQTDCVRSFVNVTTDKVYQNQEWPWGYRENEPLCGFDPYSNSKSCSELITHSYRNSFFSDGRVAISTARAGNVIGGGDFAKDRILPDCVRAVISGKPIALRKPNSVRPYQHVLDPLMAYLGIAAAQLDDIALADSYNVGPDEGDCVTTGTLATLFCQAWGPEAGWEAHEENGPHEANYLKLDCSKLKARLGWKPRWHIQTAVEKTVEWVRAWQAGEALATVMQAQLEAFCGPVSFETGV